MQIIDTHAHLDDARYDEDRRAVIERAASAGLKAIISVGCWRKDKGFGLLPDILKANENVFGALGVHPHEAKEVEEDLPFKLIREMVRDASIGHKILAIGETGLDYHYDNSPRDAQRRVFASHISLARELALPLIIHTREAGSDTLDIMKEHGAEETGGVLHCFSGPLSLAKEALDMGFYLSFTGVVTYPKADELREVVKYVPIERILVETDCPYLPPAPHRGKRNEPSFIVNTVQEIARIKGLTPDDVSRITTLNAEELFGLKKSEPVRIAYAIRNSMYLNITNRCTNYCTFCAKFRSFTVKGHNLRLKSEPTFAECVSAIGPDPERYDEIVFCGFGEPLLRIDLVKELGMYLKRRGCKIRIDTDGLANLVHGRNVLPELQFVDCISVSLNAPDSKTYQELVKTPFGERAHPAIVFFLREAKKHISRVIASVVAVPGLDIKACERLAKEEIGVDFRVREYDVVG